MNQEHVAGEISQYDEWFCGGQPGQGSLSPVKTPQEKDIGDHPDYKIGRASCKERVLCSV